MCYFNYKQEFQDMNVILSYLLKFELSLKRQIHSVDERDNEDLMAISGSSSSIFYHFHIILYWNY